MDELEKALKAIDERYEQAMRCELLLRAIKNQKFFLRKKSEGASAAELEKIDFAYGILEKVLEQAADTRAYAKEGE